MRSIPVLLKEEKEHLEDMLATGQQRPSVCPNTHRATAHLGYGKQNCDLQDSCGSVRRSPCIISTAQQSVRGIDNFLAVLLRLQSHRLRRRRGNSRRVPTAGQPQNRTNMRRGGSELTESWV